MSARARGYYEGLVTARLAHIAHVNPRLHAVATVAAERALEQAHSLDQRLATGEALGPLAGLVFSAKDQFATAGVRTTGNLPRYRAYIPTRDHPLVRRLVRADAILVGKTTLEDAGHSPLFPLARHPLDTTRLPGGSSSGSAVAVASGMTDFDLATDTGGSVLVPAHYCGLFGLRPASAPFRLGVRGLVSHERPGVRLALGRAGILAGSLDVLRRVYAVLAGTTTGTATGNQYADCAVACPATNTAPSAPAGRGHLLDWRIAATHALPGMPTQRAIQEGIASLGQRARRAGLRWHESLPVSPTLLGEAFACYEALWDVANAVTSRACSGQAWLHAWAAAHVRRQHLIAAWGRALAHDDVWCCPVAMTTAPPRPDPPTASLVVTVDGVTVTQEQMLAPARLAIVLGRPAATLPLAADTAGLPYGLLVMGCAGGEAQLLECCAALEAIRHASE